MKKETKLLIIIFLVISLIKSLLSYFIPSPSIFSDEYVYAKMAWSFFNNFNLNVHTIPTIHYTPLYPIIISLSYIFSDMTHVYFIMKILNVLLSSLIILPTYLLSKEFLDKKTSVLISILVSIIPSSFAFSSYIMAENLFYPLFLFSIYFIYKSFTNENYGWDILSGIFIALTILTKTSGYILIGVVILMFIFNLFKKHFYEIKKKLVMLVFFIIFISPWVIRNKILTGMSLFNPQIILGRYTGEITRISQYDSTVSFLTWILLYFGFLALSTLIIFFIMNLNLLFLSKKIEDKKLKIYLLISLVTIFLTVTLGANHAASIYKGYPRLIPWITGRPIGRYIDVILPLLFINGFISFQLFYKKYKKIFIYSSIITAFFLIIATQLTLFPLFPLNNMSVTWVGLSKYIIEFILFQKTSFDIVFYPASMIIITILFLAILSFFLFLHLKDKLSLKKLVYPILIFLILLSISNYAINYYNAKTYWYDGEQMQLGLYYNEIAPKNSFVLFDQRDCTENVLKLDQTTLCNPEGQTTIMGFWMNANIIQGSVDNLKGIDYVVTRHTLNLKLLKETKSGIKLYKT